MIVLRLVPTIRPNAQGNLKSWMPGSNCETWRQICDDLGSNIYYCAGPIITVDGRNIASDYVDILGNQVHRMVHMFFTDSDVIFVESCFEQHYDAPQQLPWPAQSADLLCSVLESRLRSRFCTPYHPTAMFSSREQAEKQILHSISSNRCVQF